LEKKSGEAADVESVRTDANTLVTAGVINRTKTGAVELPFDEIRVDFVVKAN
jgi:hypothetical protein